MHTIVILAAVFVFLLDGITGAEISASFRRFPARFLPIVLTPIAAAIVSFITTPQSSEGEKLFAIASFPGIRHYMVQNAFAFLAHWLLVVPLTIPWLALRFRQITPALLLVPLVGASLLSVRLGWVAFAAAATCVVLADILWDAIQRRDRDQLALWLWLFLPVPAFIYIHLPSKYLLPSVPAAAILVVRLIPEARRASMRWLIPAVATAGAVLGLLILSGIADLAKTQRRAVAEMIEPRVKLGEHVWFAGHWGFQWYAELAGATPLTVELPSPRPGETIVVSKIDLAYITRTWTNRQVLQSFCYPSSRLGRVMDYRGRAGFFSSPFGYLPWIWGSGAPGCFEVWRAE